MKRRFKIVAVTVVFLFVISIGLNIAFAVSQGADPGSDQDPIVSKSYVDAAFSQLASKIQTLLEQNDTLKKQNTELTSRLAAQEKALKAFQDELEAVKKSGVGSGTSGNAGGNTGTGKTGVSTGAGNTGSIGSTGGTGTKPAASIGKGVVNVDALNVRAQTNTTSKIVSKVYKNEIVTLVSKSGEWYKITTSKGISGYVMAKFVTIKK
jgi:hypothetical protein